MWKARRSCELSKGGGRRWKAGIAESSCQSSLRARFSIRLPPPVISTAFRCFPRLMGSSAQPAFSDSPCARGALVMAAPACSAVEAQQRRPVERVAPQSLAKLPAAPDSEYQTVRPPTRRRYLRLGWCMMAPARSTCSVGRKSTRRASGWMPSHNDAFGRIHRPRTAARLFERIMNDWPHPEMRYRGCLEIIRWQKSTPRNAWR
jgi:hypothetical protein